MPRLLGSRLAQLGGPLLQGYLQLEVFLVRLCLSLASLHKLLLEYLSRVCEVIPSADTIR